MYIDDILISGKTEENHMKTLDKVLTKLKKEGLRLKRDKCTFMLPKVQYLEHIISAEGLHPVEDKTITQAPAPAPQK